MASATDDIEQGWEPPWTLEERLKFALVPVPLYMRYRIAKERRHGEAEIALLPFLADPARVSLDIGANKGVYAWLLKDYSRPFRRSPCPIDLEQRSYACHGIGVAASPTRGLV